MQVFQLSNNVFALGNKNQRAKTVIRASGRVGHGGKIVGVRGVRPLLDDRFKIVKPTKDIVEALKERSE